MVITGAVGGCTVYANNKKIAADCDVTLPSVVFKTFTIPIMGEQEFPDYGRTESMKLKITKIGSDGGLIAMLSESELNIEIRFTQSQTDATGKIKSTGARAYLKCRPAGIPEQGIKPGDTINTDLEFFVTRYQLFIDGEEHILVDKFTNQLRMGGKDYRQEVNDLL